ncbi:MAG: hypothetical protein V2G33_07400 [bacterium JZ-2024 1]
MAKVRSLILYEVGCKVFHPLLGAGIVEELQQDDLGSKSFCIRYIWDGTISFTPVESALRIRLRKVITPEECQEVLRTMTGFPSPIEESWRIQQHFFDSTVSLGNPITNASLWNRLASKRKKDLTPREIKCFNLLSRLLISELALARDMRIPEVQKEVWDLYERNKGGRYFHRF